MIFTASACPLSTQVMSFVMGREKQRNGGIDAYLQPETGNKQEIIISIGNHMLLSAIRE